MKIHKSTITLLLLLSFATQIMAGIKSGKTYKIVPKTHPGQSLFVVNSSLNDKAEVVPWTETDVPAQQWRAELRDGRKACTLRNVYTRKYLAWHNEKLVQSAEPFYWNIKSKDKQHRLYALIHGSDTTVWRFEEVKAQPTFTAAMRDQMADAFITHYLQDKGEGLATFINGSWGESETMEAVLDMYEQTGKKQYWNIYQDCYNYFKQKVGDTWTGGTLNGGYDWFGYDFNDDVMWHIIGAARAACLTGKREYLDDAKRNFDAVWNRANLGYVQLMRWAESSGNRNGTNSCINGPTEVAACYIGIAAADESYFEKARTIYENHRKYLFHAEDGHVDDAVVLNPATGEVVSRNPWASTYNQGTMLGAATLLYQHYHDERYRQDAERIISFAMQHLCNEHGIIKVCQNADGDFQGFKGILMRYAGLYVQTFKDKKVEAWILKNAFHAYNNTNSHHYGHSAWLTKAAEDGKYGKTDYQKMAFGASTALRAAFAVRIK